MDKLPKKRNERYIRLEQLRCAIRNAELGIGTTLASDDIRRAGNTLPDIPLPKTLPKYEKPNS